MCFLIVLIELANQLMLKKANRSVKSTYCIQSCACFQQAEFIDCLAVSLSRVHPVRMAVSPSLKSWPLKEGKKACDIWIYLCFHRIPNLDEYYT